MCLVKLTEEDKALLTGLGHTADDFPQIEDAMLKRKTSYTLNGEKISREEVVKLLGRKDYLSGISRSAFHCTAVKESIGGVILFDSTNLFK